MVVWVGPNLISQVFHAICSIIIYYDHSAHGFDQFFEKEKMCVESNLGLKRNHDNPRKFVGMRNCWKKCLNRQERVVFFHHERQFCLHSELSQSRKQN